MNTEQMKDEMPQKCCGSGDADGKRTRRKDLIETQPWPCQQKRPSYGPALPPTDTAETERQSTIPGHGKEVPELNFKQSLGLSSTSGCKISTGSNPITTKNSNLRRQPQMANSSRPHDRIEHGRLPHPGNLRQGR